MSRGATEWASGPDDRRPSPKTKEEQIQNKQMEKKREEISQFQNNTRTFILSKSQKNKKKKVSYSLGEAHLSGGVRACGKVVLKGKTGSMNKFFRPDTRFGASKKRKIATKSISYKRYGKILFQKVA